MYLSFKITTKLHLYPKILSWFHAAYTARRILIIMRFAYYIANFRITFNSSD